MANKTVTKISDIDVAELYKKPSIRTPLTEDIPVASAKNEISASKLSPPTDSDLSLYDGYAEEPSELEIDYTNIIEDDDIGYYQRPMVTAPNNDKGKGVTSRWSAEAEEAINAGMLISGYVKSAEGTPWLKKNKIPPVLSHGPMILAGRRLLIRLLKA